jgi:penicillin-binding protein 2
MAFRRLKRKVFIRDLKRHGEIDPDQIFLDSTNLPGFDVDQFEGRLEKPITHATFVWLALGCLAVGLIFVGKLWNLQITEGQAYEDRSENNRLDHTTIFANRGILYDRNKIPLAWNDLNENEEYARRVYATSTGFSHLLGYVRYPAKDSSGFYYERKFVPKDGAELEFDDELSGTNGLKIIETDALGNVLSESTLRPPVDGKNVSLSIDSQIQRKLHEYLAQTVIDRGFLAGSAVIIDVHNGEILAMTNYPEYNSQTMTDGVNKEAINKFLSDKNNPFLDRAVGGQFIPGSIMKPFIALGALEEGVIDPSKQILANGQITIPNPYVPSNPTIFKDWKIHGWVDMRRAIAVSSNVYFMAIGGGYEGQKGIGISNIEKYTKSFGFGSETGINITGEKAGNVPSPAWKEKTFAEGEWRLGDTYNSSIGQYGFQVTPIQAARAAAALANGGTLVTPTILAGSEIQSHKMTALPFADKNIRIVQEGMRSGASEGTASGLNIPGISAAAKTGTAELGITKQEVNSWVMGYWPYENPRYAFTVMMEKGPRANQIGATFVMRQLFEWMNLYKQEYLK